MQQFSAGEDCHNPDKVCVLCNDIEQLIIPESDFRKYLKADGVNEYAHEDVQLMAVVKGLQAIECEPVEIK